MIKTETVGNYIHTYSDQKMKIRQVQTGIIYDDAIDVASAGYTYTETDIPIEDGVDIDYNNSMFEEASRYLLANDFVELPEQEQPDYFNENETEPNYFG